MRTETLFEQLFRRCFFNTDKNGDGVLEKEEMRQECDDKVMRESRLSWEETLAPEQIDWLFDQIVVDPPMSWACTKKGAVRDQAAFHANGLVEINFLLDTAKDWVRMRRAHVEPWHKNPYKYFRPLVHSHVRLGLLVTGVIVIHVVCNLRCVLKQIPRVQFTRKRSSDKR